jgi:hypothetical protein
MLGTRIGIMTRRVGGVTFSDEYTAIFDAFLSEPSAVDASAQNDYVGAGLDDGWWGIGDRKHILASHAGGRDANLNWFDPTNDAKLHSIVSAPAWVQYQGYTSNGINSHGDTGYDASVDNVNYLLLDASVCVYIRTNLQSNSPFDFGSVGTANKIELNTKRADDTMSGAINGGLATGASAAIGLGMFAIDKNATGSFDLYFNGSYLETVANVETALANGDIYTMCRNNGGTPISFSTRQISKIDIGASLTAAQHLSERNAFHALMTHYGTAV